MAKPIYMKRFFSVSLDYGLLTRPTRYDILPNRVDTYCYAERNFFMEVGYIRVSTEDQNTARQSALMDARGIKKRFEEKESGKNAERKQLQADRKSVV